MDLNYPKLKIDFKELRLKIDDKRKLFAQEYPRPWSKEVALAWKEEFDAMFDFEIFLNTRKSAELIGLFKRTFSRIVDEKDQIGVRVVFYDRCEWQTLVGSYKDAEEICRFARLFPEVMEMHTYLCEKQTGLAKQAQRRVVQADYDKALETELREVGGSIDALHRRDESDLKRSREFQETVSKHLKDKCDNCGHNSKRCRH